MRYSLTIILAFYCGFSLGQDFSYPSINTKGQSIADFVPSGWTILDSATGDLNKDGIKDAAIILQYKDSVSLVNKQEDTVLAQPRILLILFKSQLTNSYDLAEESNSFILKHDNSAMSDPYQEISITKGVLKIDFHIFYNMGSWYVTNSSYKFRYDDEKFILIGADLSTIHRASLDFEEYSYNFLTKKRSYTKGNEQKGTRKTTTKSISIVKPVTFKDFTEPFSLEIENDVYL